MRKLLVLVLLAACGDDDDGVETVIDASPSIDGRDLSVDAAPPCQAIGSAGTQGSSPDLFGAIVYFGGDELELPAGRYQIRYKDGCMKYGSGQDWTIHAVTSASQWYLGTVAGEQLAVPPGTLGYVVGNGAHATFAECVAANLALPPLDFEFAGGRLGVWLLDSPVSDNTTGEEGRNPTWEIAAAETCVDAGPR